MFKRFFAVLASILVLLVPFIVKEFDFVEASSKSGIDKHVSFNEDWIDISTVDDFEKINENPKGNFRLINDIDVSGVGGPLVSEDFSGRFVGNGYEIKTTHRIFERVESGYISDQIGRAH